MIENIHVVAFLTCDGVVHVGEIPTLGYPQVVYHANTVTVPAVTQLVCSSAGRFYGVSPAWAAAPHRRTHNYVLVLDECLGGSVSFPHSHIGTSTPMFDTVEQAITYCDLVAQET